MGIEERIGDLLRRAVERASGMGTYIGMVSRLHESRTSEGRATVRVDVEPEVYFRYWRDLSVIGRFLGVVDPKTGYLISLRIRGVTRVDAMSEFREVSRSSPTGLGQEAESIITNTVIEAEPLLAYDPDSGRLTMANFAIEPQSPVIIPKPEVLIPSLGLFNEGVPLGALTVGDEAIEYEGRPTILRIPVHALYQHTFVVGTTGAGKSTFLKNLIYAISRTEPRSRILVLDVTGDYLHVVLPSRWGESVDREVSEGIRREAFGEVAPFGRIKIVLPVTNDFLASLGSGEGTAFRDLVTEYADRVYRDYVENYLGEDFEILGVREEVVQARVGNTFMGRVRMRAGARTFEVDVVPFAFIFSEVWRELGELSPYFTAQARRMLDSLFEFLGRTAQESLSALITRLGMYDAADIERRTRIHKGTIDNIYRSIKMLADIGIFDVYLKDQMVREPDVFAFLEPGVPVIVDLSAIMGKTHVEEQGRAIVSFRILDSVFMGRRGEASRGEPLDPIFVVIDEAHRFFPSSAETQEEKESLSIVSKKITNIARLGRARKMGLIFSTHSPRDVNSIVLQLTNNKVIFRVDPVVVKDLGIPQEYQSMVTRFSDRTALVRSHLFRIGYVTMKTSLPLVGHYDRAAV